MNFSHTLLAAVAIDGPLALGLQIVDRYRSAEALLSRGSFQKRCKPGPTDSPTGKNLHLHATKLAKLVTQLEYQGRLTISVANHKGSIHKSLITEAFPDAFMAVMLSEPAIAQITPGRGKSDRLWKCLAKQRFPANLIEVLSPLTRLSDPVDSITDHDQQAAFVCALTALCVSKDRYVAVGDPEDGHIIMPPVEVWGREFTSGDCWAEKVLRKNVDSVRQNRKGYTNHEKAQVIRNGKRWLP